MQMPATIEDLEAAIQDTLAQASSILLLNQNVLAEYEIRQTKVLPHINFIQRIKMRLSLYITVDIQRILPFRKTWYL